MQTSTVYYIKGGQKIVKWPLLKLPMYKTSTFVIVDAITGLP